MSLRLLICAILSDTRHKCQWKWICKIHINVVWNTVLNVDVTRVSRISYCILYTHVVRNLLTLNWIEKRNEECSWRQNNDLCCIWKTGNTTKWWQNVWRVFSFDDTLVNKLKVLTWNSIAFAGHKNENIFERLKGKNLHSRKLTTIAF